MKITYGIVDSAPHLSGCQDGQNALATGKYQKFVFSES
jgi:hypothetical protein